MLSVASAGQAEYLGTDRLAACLLKFSAMTWKIVVGIHWEALKLWLKGERFVRARPLPSRSATGIISGVRAWRMNREWGAGNCAVSAEVQGP